MAGIALVVAFVTFRWLSSTGRAKTHYGELGGAAAGFIVTFGVLVTAYYSLEPRWANTHDLKAQVARQQRVIESSKLPTGFSVPASYTPVLDRTHGLAYGYPSRWRKAYSLDTFEQNPLSVGPSTSPISLVVVAEPVQQKTYSVAQVYQAARESGIPAGKVKDKLGVALNSKSAKLQVSVKDVLTLLGAHGSDTRGAIYDSSFRLLRASLAGTFVRRDDRMIDGVPSLDVEHRGRGGAGGLLQFLSATYVPQRAAVISMTFTSTARNRQALNDVRERVISTLKFLPQPG
jgi:hypothetical protein